LVVLATCRRQRLLPEGGHPNPLLLEAEGFNSLSRGRLDLKPTPNAEQLSNSGQS
jgi:hypothetical protein